jgi:nicotinate-nucleotide adenylyltransferase
MGISARESTPMSQGPIAILGGTFNPIHNGHLRSALELRQRLQLAEVRLMPAAVPPHRAAPTCPAPMRVEMVRQAVADEAGLSCDPRELERAGPSYSIDSLAEIRAELGASASISLVMGADAVASLDDWHRWRELTDFAHVIVIARPGWEIPRRGSVAEWLQQRLTEAVTTLQHEPCGGVYIESLTPLAISSTEIRRQIAAGESPRYLLPDVVWRTIQSAGLYGHGSTAQEKYAICRT